MTTVLPHAGPEESGADRAPHRGMRPLTPSVVRASAAGLVGILVVLLLDWSGVLRGPVAFGLAIVLVAALPSARSLSRRIALNGAIALGFVPFLWWFPWPASAAISHSGLVLALAAGAVVVLIVKDGRSRRSLVPTLAPVDLLPVAVGLFSAWFMRPFVTYDSGRASLSVLTNIFGRDNVAHFDMFEMIRQSLTFGSGWPASGHDSSFVYISYPQHFHIFSAFAAELWAGPVIAGVDVEAGLFSIGAFVTMMLAVVVLAAAISSLTLLRQRPGLAAIVIASSLSIIVLGSGAGAFTFGFPSFFLAFVATLIAVVLALNPGVTTRAELLAVTAVIVVVAHSWSLLVPVAAVALVGVLWRLPWSGYRARPLQAIPAGLIVAVLVAAVGSAAYLVTLQTQIVGAPDAVLSLPGGLPPVSARESFLIGLLLLAVCLASLGVRRGTGRWSRFSGPLFLLGLACATGLLVGGALVAIQLHKVGSLSYYQLKFLMAMNIVFSVLLVLAIVLWVADASAKPSGVLGRLLSATAVAILVGVVLVTGAGLFEGGAVTSTSSAGLKFRADAAERGRAVTAAPESDDITRRLTEAASLMKTWPCARPIYLASRYDAASLADSNQWAMSLSSTWTESASPINAYLAKYKASSDVPGQASIIIDTLLTGQPDRCVIIAPAAKETLDPSTAERNAGRIFTW